MGKLFHDTCNQSTTFLHDKLTDEEAALRYFQAMEMAKEIGRRISAAREAKGLKQREVCVLVPGLTVSALSNYEQGTRKPDPEVIKKLAVALNTR